MNKILVTGATGCIGSNLIIELIHQGYSVRAFHRSTSNSITLKGVNVEHYLGDILDTSSLCEAISGCDVVVHAAALVTFWKRKRDEQFKINVLGTRNVIDCCIKQNVKKLVHVSTIATLGYRKDNNLIDESSQYNWGERYSYRYTKYLAELEVLKGVDKGLDATIVNPSIIIGPRDIHAHGGTIIIGVKLGRIPFYPKGGINIVNVHDVVQGIISAIRLGRKGERYILGGFNMTTKEVFQLTANVLKGKAPKIGVPNWLVKSSAVVSEVFGVITRTNPPLTTDLAAAVGLLNWYSIEKAEKELGYKRTSIETAILEAYNWYKENGMI